METVVLTQEQLKDLRTQLRALLRSQAEVDEVSLKAASTKQLNAYLLQIYLYNLEQVTLPKGVTPDWKQIFEVAFKEELKRLADDNVKCDALIEIEADAEKKVQQGLEAAGVETADAVTEKVEKPAKKQKGEKQAKPAEEKKAVKPAKLGKDAEAVTKQIIECKTEAELEAVVEALKTSNYTFVSKKDENVTGKATGTGTNKAKNNRPFLVIELSDQTTSRPFSDIFTRFYTLVAGQPAQA